MMSPYGEGLDPIPYITGSYAVAVALIGGFAAWIAIQRKQLRTLRVAVQRKDR